MPWETTATVFTLLVGAIFVIMHALALILAIRVKKGESERFRSIMVHVAFVSGLTAFVYVWNLGTEDQRIRWIAYSLCSPVLLLTVYEVATWHSPKRPYPALVRALLVATFVSVVSGYFIAVDGLSDTIRYISYGVAFVPFAFIPFLLCTAIKRQKRHKNGVPTSAYIFGVFWLAYPIIYILSPINTGLVSIHQAQLFYVLTDIVTKVFFELYYGWWAYNMWILRYDKHVEIYDVRDERRSRRRRGKRISLSESSDECLSNDFDEDSVV